MCILDFMRLLKHVLLALALLTSVSLVAQPAYKLDFKIEGLNDTTLLLGHYYLESTYAKDTAKSTGGSFSFDGKKPLGPGVYFLIKGKTRLFEFVIGKSQHFTMTTNTSDYVSNMKVTGDIDNQLFFDNMRFNMERNREAEPFVKIMQDSTLTDEAKKKEAREALSKINDKVIAHQNGVIEKYPDTFTARLFKVNKRVEIPEAPKKPDGTIDSTFHLRYYRDHYFDYFDLADDGLLRLSKNHYKEKVEEYLDRLFAPEADTLTKVINKLIAIAKKNQETYKYLTFMCMQKYIQPKYMGQDQIFVNLYDQYVATGEMNYWMNEKFRQNYKEQANRIRSSALGRKSNNLVLRDVNGAMRSLHTMTNKYTVVYFYDPDCGHCKKETPKLVAFKNATKMDVGVYTVGADTSMTKIKKYVKDMQMEKLVNTCFYYSAVGNYRDLYDAETTPMIYILDREKKIIARKLQEADEIGPFLERYERFQEAKSKAQSKSTP